MLQGEWERGPDTVWPRVCSRLARRGTEPFAHRELLLLSIIMVIWPPVPQLQGVQGGTWAAAPALSLLSRSTEENMVSEVSRSVFCSHSSSSLVSL